MKKIKNILVYSSSLFLRKAETKNIIKYLSQKCSTVDTHLIEDETSASNNKYDLILSISGDGIIISFAITYKIQHKF